MSATILVVDDSASMRSMITSLVESLGYKAIPADSGEQACELFAENEIDIAVLDVTMEGIDGFETCRRLRNIARDGWFPVIYLSATNSTEYIVEGLDAGGDAYVAKPVNPRVLEAILKAMGRIADMKMALNRANEQLQHYATYDGLTKIPNRRAFDDTLRRHELQARRENTDLALLLIDLDYFKAYNDHYGHVAGDSCLVQFAEMLANSLLRPIDFVARYGGEEFVVILPKTSVEGAEEVAERIQRNLELLAIAHEKSQISSRVTASIGIAISPSGEVMADLLLERADQALYQAKNDGRNRFVVAD